MPLALPCGAKDGHWEGSGGGGGCDYHGGGLLGGEVKEWSAGAGGGGGDGGLGAAPKGGCLASERSRVAWGAKLQLARAGSNGIPDG